jgi:hypothetical protein
MFPLNFRKRYSKFNYYEKNRVDVLYGFRSVT